MFACIQNGFRVVDGNFGDCVPKEDMDETKTKEDNKEKKSEENLTNN